MYVGLPELRGAFQVAAPTGTLVEVVVWLPSTQFHLIVSPTKALTVWGVNWTFPTLTVLMVASAFELINKIPKIVERYQNDQFSRIFKQIVFM
jgi:hypothetical protein